jgi:hypothetical protein
MTAQADERVRAGDGLARASSTNRRGHPASDRSASGLREPTAIGVSLSHVEKHG